MSQILYLRGNVAIEHLFDMHGNKHENNHFSTCMENKKCRHMRKNISVEFSEFLTELEVPEYHMMVHGTNPALTFAEQVHNIKATLDDTINYVVPGAKPIFCRFFLSDAANQAGIVQEAFNDMPPCAVSIVQQPPLDGTKIALWVYMLKDVDPHHTADGMITFSHNGYEHLWTAALCGQNGSSETQTLDIFNKYITSLSKNGCTLDENCIRTWFLVHDVDINYSGVVKARNDVFASQGLTKDTHFIASTGIGGGHANPKASVQMDAYAVKGLKKEQIKYLYASTHLNPTYEYGVSFERGVCVDYGERRQVFISGTASINNKGEILYPGDIRKQVERMLENVEALLAEADCTFDDMGQMLIYLRDIADYSVVKSLFDERFPDMPRVILLAPVCRPGWLIEMECMGVKFMTNQNFRDF